MHWLIHNPPSPTRARFTMFISFIMFIRLVSFTTFISFTDFTGLFTFTCPHKSLFQYKIKGIMQTYSRTWWTSIKYQPWYGENKHEEHDQQDNHLHIKVEKSKKNTITPIPSQIQYDQQDKPPWRSNGKILTPARKSPPTNNQTVPIKNNFLRKSPPWASRSARWWAPALQISKPVQSLLTCLNSQYQLSYRFLHWFWYSQL